jgi:hypothetical protein
MDQSIHLSLSQTLSEHEVITMINSSLSANDPRLVFFIASFMPKQPELLKRRRRIFALVKTMSLANSSELEIQSCNANIWLESDRILVGILLRKVEEFGSLREMEQSIANPRSVIAEVVSLFPSDAFGRVIFPNKLGDFYQYTQLKVSSIEHDLGRSHSPHQKAIASILFQTIDLTGHQIEKEVIDESFVQEKLKLANFSLEDATSLLQSFLRDRNNYSGESFGEIFRLLSQLDREYSFRRIREFQERKEEMFYAISSQEEKEMVIDLLTDRSAHRKIKMVKDLTCEEIEEAIELRNIVEGDTESSTDPRKRHLLTKRLIGGTYAFDDGDIEILTDALKDPHLTRKFIKNLKRVKTATIQSKVEAKTEPKQENTQSPETQNQTNQSPLKRPKHEIVHPIKKEADSVAISDTSSAAFTFNPFFAQLGDSEPKDPKLGSPGSEVTLVRFYAKRTGRRNSNITQENNRRTSMRYTAAMTRCSVRKVHQHLATLKAKYDLKNAGVRSTKQMNVLDGVEYLGRNISIVVHAAHYGFFKVTNKEHLEVLEDPDNQLWVDDGEGEPRQMSLGALMKGRGFIGRRIRLIR